MNKRKSIFLAMLLVLALWTTGFQAPVFAAEVKQGSITVIGSDPAKPILSETAVQYGENETASEALVKILGTDKVGFTPSSYGDMITKIGDETVDNIHNYWGFYINGVAAQEGAVTYKVQDGDKLIFKYESIESGTDQSSSGSTDSSNGSTTPVSGTFPETNIKKAIDSASQYVTKQKIGDWEAISLKQLGKPIPAGYLESVKQTVKDKQGKFHSITDAERYTMGILAAGGDPTNIVGYNLVGAIYNGDVTKQGLNGVAYALIALDSATFKVPDTAVWTREKLVKQLLDKQNKDGGWTWDITSTTSDLDTTAMVLTALAPYKNQTGAKASVESAIKYITAQFAASKINNSSTAAQIIIALSALGIDANSTQFAVNNMSLVQYLLNFQNNSGVASLRGGFGYTDTNSDPFSTAFGIQALAAYNLFKEGKGSLYTLPLAQQKTETNPTKNVQPSTQPAKETNAGHLLPDTATNSFNLVIFGLIILLLGMALFIVRNQRKA
jgi:LPXTG-motif cell wall-anchored protein